MVNCQIQFYLDGEIQKPLINSFMQVMYVREKNYILRYLLREIESSCVRLVLFRIAWRCAFFFAYNE